MMRQFFCLLLIPLMLANQGQLIAHAHHGTDVAKPEGHASRPHFHVGGHRHDSAHDHEQHSDHSHRDHSRHVPESEEQQTPVVSPVGEHDSDAVYLAESVTFAGHGNSASALSVKDVAQSAILHVANHGDGLLRLGPLLGPPASVFEAACPVYLRTLSLRL